MGRNDRKETGRAKDKREGGVGRHNERWMPFQSAPTHVLTDAFRPLCPSCQRKKCQDGFAISK